MVLTAERTTSIFAVVGLPVPIALPGCHSSGLLIWKISRLFLNSFGKDVEGPLAESFVVKRYGRTLLRSVAHVAEHTPSSGGQWPAIRPPAPSDLWCNSGALRVHDPLVCGPTSSTDVFSLSVRSYGSLSGVQRRHPEGCKGYRAAAAGVQLLRLSQHPVLPASELEVDPAPARLNRVLKHLPRLRRAHSRSLRCQLPYTLGIGKGELIRQRSLEVG
jgi:hypothetical protein